MIELDYMGEVIFNFMCDVKEKLEALMPDALITVEPYQRAGVMIRAKWRDESLSNISHFLSLAEIVDSQINLAESCAAGIKALRDSKPMPGISPYIQQFIDKHDFEREPELTIY